MSNYEEFVFTWRIENIHMCPHKNGENITSPIFSAKGLFNTDWCLTLYPRDNGVISENFMACYLKRKWDNGPEEIEIDFVISINSVKGRSVRCCFRKDGVRYGYSDCLRPSEENLFNKVCIVECHMSMCVKNTTTPSLEETGSGIFPSFWKPDSLHPNIFKEFSFATESQFEDLRRNIWKYPKQCFVRSRVVVEKRCVKCGIKDVVNLKETEKLYLPVLSCSKNPSLLVCLHKNYNDEEDNLQVELSFIDKLEKNVFVACKMQIACFEDETRNTTENEYLFESHKVYDTWRFETNIQWSNLKRYENMNFYFIFSISDGSLLSNIESSESVDYTSSVITKQLPPCIASDEMFSFYIQKKFCDVTLRTDQQNFEAHKNVLCAMSPVFAAMFESGMKESSTNNILIEDLDSETVRYLLTFLYTGKIEELNISTAVKMFTAADKYQITLLKEICRNYLKRNMCVENVVTILLLSDMHQDIELKESGVYFVYKHAVFLSQQWKNLVNNNPQLALEILQDMCSKYF